MNSIRQSCIKTKKLINRGKTGKAPNKEKPVKHINNNTQSFLEISPVQKEAQFWHKLQGLHMSNEILLD